MCRKDEYLLFKSRVTMSNHFNFVIRKTFFSNASEKNASENVICFSRLLHILTYVGLSIETNSVDPIDKTSVVCKHVGPRSGPTKSRALGRRKVGPYLDPNCLTLLWN